MNKYMITVILVPIIYFACSLLLGAILNNGNKETKIVKNRLRGGISQNRESNSALKEHLEELLERKTDYDKKFKMETMFLQSGYELSLGEYRIYCISFAIALPLLMLIIMNNIFLSVIFAFIGYKIPSQYLKNKANKRVIKMNDQIGSFLRMVIERYKNSKDLAISVAQSIPDFMGYEPIYSELKKTGAEIDMGLPIEDILDSLARRTGSKYLTKFSDYAKMTREISTHEAKTALLVQAYEQYMEDRELQTLLKKEISGPVRDAMIMVMATPLFMAYQSVSTDGYLDFLLHDKIGQFGFATIVGVLLLCVWFINSKIGAPID